MEGKLLTKEDILRVEDIIVEEEEVPEWGGYVRLKPLTGKERDDFEWRVFTSQRKKMKLSNLRAELVAASIVDENNERVFSPAEVETLGNKSAKALDRLFDKVQRMNGMQRADVEAMTSNLLSGQGDDSTSE